MPVEFNLPNFRVETASERRMYAYLYQTVQQLNWAMKHINTQNPVISAAAGTAGGTSPVSLGPSDLTPEVFSGIKSLIIKSADILDAWCDTAQQRFQGQYVAQSEFGTYRESTDLTLQTNSTGIAQNYTNLQQITGNLGTVQDNTRELQGALEVLRSEMADMTARETLTNAYIRTGVMEEDENGIPVYGLEIGQTNEVGGQEIFNKYARFSSSRLSFYDQNDTEVAYISDYKLYITNVHITGTLTMGEYEISTADGLAFRWIGGDG